MNRITMLKRGELETLIELWNNEPHTETMGLWLEYEPNNGVYWAMDNSKDGGWLESFYTLEDAINWLLEE